MIERTDKIGTRRVHPRQLVKEDNFLFTALVLLKQPLQKAESLPPRLRAFTLRHAGGIKRFHELFELLSERCVKKARMLKSKMVIKGLPYQVGLADPAPAVNSYELGLIGF